MVAKERTPDVLRALQMLEELNLTTIKDKLVLPEGKSWTPEQANIAEKWYKRFLSLHVLYPQHRNVPNSPIDTFWHAHILDTRKYTKDCTEIFGGMLHHFPYFGLNGDSVERDRSFKETNTLYEIEFGQNCALELAGAGHGMDCSDPCTTDEG